GICLWLPQGQWRDAAGDRAVLLFNRRDRIALALRALRHGRNGFEHVAGSGQSGWTVSHVRASSKRAQRAQACPGRSRGAVLLEHDPEKCEAVFRKDHAPTKSWSEMTIRGKSSRSRKTRPGGVRVTLRDRRSSTRSGTGGLRYP